MSNQGSQVSSRRSFLNTLAGGALLVFAPVVYPLGTAHRGGFQWADGEDVFGFIRRTRGDFDPALYAHILGAANEFKEGDAIIGVATADPATRQSARTLLARTRLKDIDAFPVYRDVVLETIRVPTPKQPVLATETLGELKQFLLESDGETISRLTAGLSSDVIGCVVKLMDNEELTRVGQKVFNPLPGSNIGAKGYLGARIQPNSPTDHPDDIFWQVLDGWSYGVGDVLLGTNPVSSYPESVAKIEHTLKDLLHTFGVEQHMPHCVLAHIDVQAEVEEKSPGATALWFQSIAGVETANRTFDISLEKMMHYADMRSGPFGLYFETGQGADFTNGHGHGFDMVLHESRKYGFARALKMQVGKAKQAAGNPGEAWVHLNDVAGFIGPEVFRSREQLVRCCLEDIVMGKLHGLCIGLDVCSTLHMDISLDDLDWCLDRIMPANPAYLMALPTKIDPMLGYLTTGYQDHVRLREKFGYRVNDPMWAFFKSLDVIGTDGQPAVNFGDPNAIYLKYRRIKGDSRQDTVVLAEGRTKMAEVHSRGVFLALGHGQKSFDLQPQLKTDISRIYRDAKKSIWAQLDSAFTASLPGVVQINTESIDRNDYILHPASGEKPNASSLTELHRLRGQHAGAYDVQIIVSDGLNALAITEEGHLLPFLERLANGLMEQGLHQPKDLLLITSGRVRAGYRIGEALFSGLPGPRTILHVIGERPGTGHRTFSTYITVADGRTWANQNEVDHNISKVVSGIAHTALKPIRGADEVLRLLAEMRQQAT